MARRQIPSPPKGTRVNGAKLWRDVLEKYELEQHELTFSREMVRTVDLSDELAGITAREGLMVRGPHGSKRKPHPAVVEARQVRIALAGLTAALRLPAGDESDPAAGRGRSGGSGCVGCISCRPDRLRMRRRPADPPPGWLFNGKHYQSEAEYERAVAARDERRRRLLSAIEAEH
jgi:hypothetical protein